ncbi:mitochondrial import inner membrane translocase subunit [Babesia ovis]|uniref:Mitochondrial import inner membrane translocase subunit TIM50 n=1 Tax=Babesia ovis TaxID=5869 RepID=A0A9W5TCL2_BABOV|nr:mitochondrial import inner membrane translocase subunit [Babesia ovis]
MASIRGFSAINPALRSLGTNKIAIYAQNLRFSISSNVWYGQSRRHLCWVPLHCRTFSTSSPGVSGIQGNNTKESQSKDESAFQKTEHDANDSGTSTSGALDNRCDNAVGKQSPPEDNKSTPKDKSKGGFPMGIFGCASMVLAGYYFAGFREKDESIMATLERGMDKVVEHVNGMFAKDDGPLLPDVKDLNYPPNLPTLVVDLDKVVAKLEYDRRTGWQVKKRPFADRFFRELINYYEIVVWSDDAYPMATDVANRWGLPVIGCIHRDRCIKFKGAYIKDLSKLGRNLNRVILLDHDRVACMLQEDNAILVREFDGDENDTELLHLIGLLKNIAVNPNDVKYQIKQYGGGLDRDIGRRFAEKSLQDTERAKARQSLSKRLGFKHF